MDKTVVINAKRDVTEPGWLAQIEAEGQGVYIGRNNSYAKPSRKRSKWYNPFKVGKDGTREECIAKYREYLLTKPDLLAQIEELRGKYLICWCAPEPCHGDILINLLHNGE
jgi:hypothetical protein